MVFSKIIEELSVPIFMMSGYIRLENIGRVFVRRLSQSISLWVIIGRIFDFNPLLKGILGKINGVKIRFIVKHQMLWNPKSSDNVALKKSYY